MRMKTDYYGDIEYEKEDLITFPDGLFGFSDLKDYLLLYLDEGDDSLLLMQSCERPEIAFTVINPFLLCPDYAPVLTPEELYFLDVKDSGDLSYYVICVLQECYLDNTVNLRCPLAVNPDTRVGAQVILESSVYGYRHKLRSFFDITETDHPEDRSECHADSQTQEK